MSKTNSTGETQSETITFFVKGCIIALGIVVILIILM